MCSSDLNVWSFSTKPSQFQTRLWASSYFAHSSELFHARCIVVFVCMCVCVCVRACARQRECERVSGL